MPEGEPGLVFDGRGGKQRLEELFSLAMVYRRWTQRELAAHLGRDAHNMAPGSGLPKLDLVVRLADAMEWTAQDVVDSLCGGYVPEPPTLEAGDTWEKLDREAHAAIVAGRFRDAVQIGRKEYVAAQTNDERALACLRQTLGWDNLGRYALSLGCCQRGLSITELKPDISVALELNLANLHYILGHVREAKGLASSLLEGLRTGEQSTHSLRGAVGFARFVLGNCFRVIAGADCRDRERNAHRAIVEFLEAKPLLLEASAERGGETLAGIADQCAGAQIEMEAMLGLLSGAAAIEKVMHRVEQAVEPHSLAPALRESCGWWCINGCNIALRHIGDDSEVEHLLGVFTNKADEIADVTQNWALRERVWALELARRSHIERTQPVTEEWVIDRDDAREIAGTMSRFPTFRETGWQVLRSSRIVED